MRICLAAFLPPVLLAAGLPALPFADEPPEGAPGSAGIHVSDLVERAEVRLLLVDVVVTDRKGNLVTDLAKEDFQLLIDGHPARIDTFELRDFRRDAVLAREEETGEEEPEPVVRRRENRLVLFFDVFNSGTAGLQRMWTRAREFLAGDVPAFDRVMIMVYSDRLRVPQEFTADRQAWRRTLNELEGQLVNKDSYVERESSRRESIAELCRQGPCADLMAERNWSYCDAAWGRVQAYTQEEVDRALKTLRALKGTIYALGGMPGRKSVVFFSEGVRRTPGRQYADAASCIECACYEGGDVYIEQFRLDHEMDDIFKSANAANIAFHTIDVRSTDRRITSGSRHGMKRYQAGGGFPRELFSNATRRGSGTEDFLINLSFHTGGLRGVATAKPKKNFQRLEDRVGTYYILGHHLERPEPDGRGHNIIVRVDRRGLDLLHRRTFEDLGWRESEERSLRGALAVPEAYTEPALAARVVSFPEEKENSVFLEVGIRMSDLAWIPTPVGELVEVEFAGAVRGLRGGVKHQFRHQLELKKGAWEGESERRLCYLEETGLEAGRYELVAAVHDIGGRTIGARRVEFEVPGSPGDGFRLTGPVLARFSRDDLVAGARPPYTRVRGFPEGLGEAVLSPVLDGDLQPEDVLLAYLRVTPPDGKPVGATRTGWVTILRDGTVVARHRPARVGAGRSEAGKPVDYAVSIPLRDLDPGEYDLRAEMTDRTAGDRLTGEVRFRIR